MIKKIRALFIGFAALLCSNAPASISNADTSTAAPAGCDNGYTIAYFNGIHTTFKGALDDLDAIQDATNADGKHPIGTVQFQLLYNPTAGGFSIADIEETFRQRAAELDATHQIADRYDIFFDLLNGRSPEITTAIAKFYPEIGKLIDALQAAMGSTRDSDLSYMNAHDTDAVYNTHQNYLDGFIAARKKILLVGHSQGNLFLNHAFAYAQPKAPDGSIKTLQIAPASTYVVSDKDYMLSDSDRVINLLRVVGKVPDANEFGLAQSHDYDFWGHSFQHVYTNAQITNSKGTTLWAEFTSKLNTALDALKSPPCPTEFKYIGGDLAAAAFPPFPDYSNHSGFLTYTTDFYGLYHFAVATGHLEGDVKFKNLPPNFTGDIYSGSIYIDYVFLSYGENIHIGGTVNGPSYSQCMFDSWQDSDGVAMPMFRFKNGQIVEWFVAISDHAPYESQFCAESQSSAQKTWLITSSKPHPAGMANLSGNVPSLDLPDSPVTGGSPSYDIVKVYTPNSMGVATGGPGTWVPVN